LAQLGRRFITPHLRSLNILPTQRDEAQHAGATVLLPLVEIIGEACEGSSPPSVVFSIADYLRAEHEALSDVVAHLVAAVPSGCADADKEEEEEERRRQRWVELVGRLEQLKEVLPPYLALLQSTHAKGTQVRCSRQST
jgi:hypothetical protein